MPKNRLVKRLQDEAKQLADDAMFIATMRRLDYVFITLGRLGMNKEFLNKFYKEFCKVENEYNELFIDDLKNDREYVYSRTKLDEAVHLYCGDEYPSYKERYRLKD